jgi:type IV fimbrial biogenesis protein FimT
MFRASVKRSRGFTLIELMITLVVLTVLVLLAVPSFRDYIEKARVRGAADQVTDLLARARASAVKSNLPVSITAAGSESTAWCIGARMAAEPAAWALRADTAPTCDCTAPANCLVDSQPLFLDSADLSSGTPPTATIDAFSFSYSPKLGGVRTSASKSFLLDVDRSIELVSPNGRYHLSVGVTPLGQSYVCVPAGNPVFLGYRTCS